MLARARDTTTAVGRSNVHVGEERNAPEGEASRAGCDRRAGRFGRRCTRCGAAEGRCTTGLGEGREVLGPRVRRVFARRRERRPGRRGRRGAHRGAAVARGAHGAGHRRSRRVRGGVQRAHSAAGDGRRLDRRHARRVRRRRHHLPRLLLELERRRRQVGDRPRHRPGGRRRRIRLRSRRQRRRLALVDGRRQLDADRRRDSDALVRRARARRERRALVRDRRGQHRRDELRRQRRLPADESEDRLVHDRRPGRRQRAREHHDQLDPVRGGQGVGRDAPRRLLALADDERGAPGRRR
jgi:hypothetical protein